MNDGDALSCDPDMERSGAAQSAIQIRSWQAREQCQAPFAQCRRSVRTALDKNILASLLTGLMKLIYVMHLGSLEVLRSVARITRDVEWRRKRGSQRPHEMRKE